MAPVCRAGGRQRKALDRWARRNPSIPWLSEVRPIPIVHSVRVVRDASVQEISVDAESRPLVCARDGGDPSSAAGESFTYYANGS